MSLNRNMHLRFSGLAFLGVVKVPDGPSSQSPGALLLPADTSDQIFVKNPDNL